MRPEIEWAVQGIHEGFEEHLSIVDLGRMARLSPCHMARLFHEETGLTPSGFLLAVRMEQARRKLLTTHQGIAAIADEVGYASLGAFTSRFTKVSGVPPGKYRQLRSLGSSVTRLLTGAERAHFTYGSITGRVLRSDGLDNEPTYIAAFPVSGEDTPPCCRRNAKSAAPWKIHHIPSGMWMVEAVSRTVGDRAHCVAVGQAGSFRINAGSVVHVDIALGSLSRLRGLAADRIRLGTSIPELLAC